MIQGKGSWDLERTIKTFKKDIKVMRNRKIKGILSSIVDEVYKLVIVGKGSRITSLTELYGIEVIESLREVVRYIKTLESLYKGSKEKRIVELQKKKEELERYIKDLYQNYLPSD